VDGTDHRTCHPEGRAQVASHSKYAETANTLAKLAHGQADNLLTITALAARCPILLVPAMDGGMWSNAATQANVTTLRERGFHFVGPARGRMASGLIGEGRMVEPAEIFGHVRVVLGVKDS